MSAVKHWYQSKTVWVNAVIIVLAVLDALQALPAIPASWLPYIVAAGGVLNVVLRLTTSSGIAGFVPPQGEAMRAAPAPEPAPAPEAGAPSLAEQIARDNGLDPEAHD